MFEGLVRQLLLGYLGRYVKDIQREQLKITLWNEEVLLENVELILEAFDYLRLPFALREGRVGRLSIRIPWKKLGWDPIIIVLEDVFVRASDRRDEEVSPRVCVLMRVEWSPAIRNCSDMRCLVLFRWRARRGCSGVRRLLKGENSLARRRNLRLLSLRNYHDGCAVS